jgi:hypothetical protein
MLDNEWTHLLTQLSKSRGSQTRFFCFVDNVSARNFAGTNDSHGWIGLRFQLQPGGRRNDVFLHVKMRDPSNVLQQQAIGILGVNLIYAAFYEGQTKESFLEGVAQDVVAERIEIDHVDLRRPAFESWDRRALLVHLVRGGLAEAVCFSSMGSTVPLSRFFIRKLLCLHRDILATRIQPIHRFICDCWLRINHAGNDDPECAAAVELVKVQTGLFSRRFNLTDPIYFAFVPLRTLRLFADEIWQTLQRRV